MRHDPNVLPPDLPIPEDDGSAAHLPGTAMPPIELASTDGGLVRVDLVPEGAERLVLYAYPRTGRPGEAELTPDWDRIPGARGCTPRVVRVPRPRGRARLGRRFRRRALDAGHRLPARGRRAASASVPAAQRPRPDAHARARPAHLPG